MVDAGKLCVAIAGLGAACLPAPASSQAYPNRPIAIVVPYSAGGPSDIVARLFAEHLRVSWKQPVPVDNRPGANTMVGTLAVARAAPDGYTLLLTGASLSSFKALVRNPEVDAVRDLAAISQIGIAPVVVSVSSQTPVTSLAELIAYAKARPGKLNYATVGGGNTLTAETFNQLVGIDVVRIAYKGEPPAVLALVRNEVQIAFLSPIAVKTLVASGQAKALSLSTAAIRSRAVPAIPTSSEAGLHGLDQAAWFGLLAPAQTSNEIRRKLAREVVLFVAQPEVASRFAQLGIEPVSSSPEEFSALIAAETAKFTQVARSAKIEQE